MYTASRLPEHTSFSVMSKLVDTKLDNVAQSSLPWLRSLLPSTDLRFGYVPKMTANKVNAGCES